VRPGCGGIDGRAGSQTDLLEGGRPEGGDRHGCQPASDRPSPPAPMCGRGHGHSVGTDRDTARKAAGQTGLTGGRPERPRANLMATTRGRPAPNVAQEAGGAAWAALGQVIVSEK
jgi:hypothetical protein